MRWYLLASLFLIACNQIYGLDKTHSLDAFEQYPDADQDSIADDKDNCPTVANFDQLDSDDDGIGNLCDACEACDPCSKGPLHDEDGDHVSDLCDPCPASEMNTDSDGDGIGDACEHAMNVPQRRTVFDGFFQTSTDWLEGGARWEIANDVITVKSGVAMGVFEYIRIDTLPSATNWYIETTVTLAANFTDAIASISVSPPPMGTGMPRNCGIANTGPGMSSLVLSGVPPLVLPTPVTGPVRLRFAAENPVGATQRVRCSIVGTPHQSVVTLGVISYPLTLRITANRPGTAFSYFDVVTP